MKRHNHSARRYNRTLLCCALASCFVFGAPTLFAQSTAAAVKGRVALESIPAANAKVTATNIATGLTRSVASGSDGSYDLVGLPPGPYRIDVMAGGKTSSRQVTLQVGQTTTLDIGVGGVAEAPTGGDATTLGTINVIAPAFSETKTSELATYITQKQMAALPQGTRNFLAFADTVPGMQFVTDSQGNTRVRSGAQSANAINVFIDGVGQKNYVLTGGISGQDTSRGNPFPQSAIGEYKVITQNYKAEFDQLSSAAIVAVTRSGTNTFNGDAFGDFTSTNWRSRSVFEEQPGATKAVSMDQQYGLSFGGPIVADRSHYFLAYEAKQYSSPSPFNLGRGYSIDQLPAEFQSEYGSGVFTRPFKENLYFGKIDWLIGEDHYFEFTTKYRDEVELIQIGDQRLPSSGTDNTNNETRMDLRYQFTHADWFNDAHLTYEKSFWSPRPHEFSPGYILSDGNWFDTIARIGGSDNFQDKGQKGYSFQDDLTFTGLKGHTLKAGIKYKAVTVDTLEQNKFNPQFYYDINESLTNPTHVEFGAPVSGLGDGTVTSRNKQFGIYVQDDWEVNDKLVFNLGVRWDYETTPSYENFVTPPDVVAALQASNTNLPNSGVNINDYISTGHNRDAFKDAIAPRAGFSYDLNADQRHVIHGGIGRSYDRNLFDYLQNEVSKGSWGSYAYDFNTAAHPCSGANCLTWDPSYMNPDVLRALAAAGGAREVYLTNNNLKVPYSDQFSIGMRNTFAIWGNDWNTDITLSRIESHDGIAFLLGNRRDDGSFFPTPDATDPPPWGQGFAPFSNMILGQNAQETRANALYLQLEKPYTHQSGWGATIAYTYTDAEQNSPINGFPGAFNQPTIEQYGWFAGLTPKNRLVATGIYDAPWDITLSAKLTLASAEPRYIQDCNEVSWSLCHFTWYRPDHNFKQFDLAASKEWKAGPDVRFRIRADVLNVFNWANYSGYDDWMGGANEPMNPNFGNPNSVSLPTRTLKMSMGFTW